MPYIPESRREDMMPEWVEGGRQPDNVGELTFLICDKIDDYLYLKDTHGGVTYAVIAECIAALETAKLELYRRVGAPYEDKKLAANGDVFSRTYH